MFTTIILCSTKSLQVCATDLYLHNCSTCSINLASDCLSHSKGTWVCKKWWWSCSNEHSWSHAGSRHSLYFFLHTCQTASGHAPMYLVTCWTCAYVSSAASGPMTPTAASHLPVLRLPVPMYLLEHQVPRLQWQHPLPCLQQPLEVSPSALHGSATCGCQMAGRHHHHLNSREIKIKVVTRAMWCVDNNAVHFVNKQHSIKTKTTKCELHNKLHSRFRSSSRLDESHLPGTVVHHMGWAPLQSSWDLQMPTLAETQVPGKTSKAFFHGLN